MPRKAAVPLRRVLLFAEAYLCVCVVDLVLRTGGFDAVRKWLLRPWRRSRREIRADTARVKDVEWAVLTACAWQSRTALCFHRSVSAYLLLQARGACPRFVMAVRSRPFGSHAWIEMEGRVLADTMSPEVRSRYIPVLKIPAVPAPQAGPAGPAPTAVPEPPEVLSGVVR